MSEIAHSLIGPVGATVAANIRTLRRQRRLSQKDLAAKLSELGHATRRGMVTAIETSTRSVTVDNLVAFAEALGVSPLRLLGGTKDGTFEDGFNAGWERCRMAAFEVTYRPLPPEHREPTPDATT